MAAFAVCRGHANKQSRDPAAVPQAAVQGGGAPGAPIDAPRASPIEAQIAATDAATDATDAPTDAAIDAFAPAAVVPAAEVPDFGCLGWSMRRGLVACIVGSRGFNVGDSTVSLVFRPLRAGVEVPEPITLLQRTEVEGRGPDELPAAQAAELAAQLRGFVTLDRSAAVEAHFVDDHLAVTPPVTVGGATLSLRATRHGTVVFAPKVRAVLTLRLPGRAPQVLETEEGAVGGYTAHLFSLDRAIVVERRYHIGDEGTSGNFGDVWVCIAGRCDSEPTEPSPSPASPPPPSSPPSPSPSPASPAP